MKAPTLTHYSSREAIENMVRTRGFAFKANKRRLIDQLIPAHDWSAREPQEFGMISFTEALPHEAGNIRKNFGGFGIRMKSDWLERHRAGRVLYISTTSLAFEAFRSLFGNAYSDLKSRIRFPEDGVWQMAFTNKAAAATIAGSTQFASVLQLFEFFESEDNSWQREWRIVNSLPLYSVPKTKAELLEIVSPPQGWIPDVSMKLFGPGDVVEFVCPNDSMEVFRKALGDPFSKIPVIGTRD